MTLVVSRSLGSPAVGSSGTRPARRAARASSAMVGISSARLIGCLVGVGTRRPTSRPRPRRRRSPGSGPASRGAGRRSIDDRLGLGARPRPAAGSAVRFGRRLGRGRVDVGVGLGARRRRRLGGRPRLIGRRRRRRRLGLGLGDGSSTAVGLRRRTPISTAGVSASSRRGSAARAAARPSPRSGSGRPRREALEERGHLGLEGGDACLDPLDAALDRRRRGASSSRSRTALRVEMRSRSLRGCGRSRPSTSRGCAATSSSARPAQLGGLLGGGRRGRVSMAALASAAKRSSVSARAASAAACMAFVRSAMNLLGLPLGGRARREPARDVGGLPARRRRPRPRSARRRCLGLGVFDRATVGDGSGVSVSWAAARRSIMAVPRSPRSRERRRHRWTRQWPLRCGSPDSARSELHGSRKPGRVSVCAMRQSPRWSS